MPNYDRPGQYTQKDREKIPPEDFGDPKNRKFPIVDPQDVEDAARLHGRAQDPEAVKRRIIEIAKRKGPEFTARLPTSWREEYRLADSGNLKVPFFRLGKWRHPVYGVIEGTQETFGKLVENFRRNVLGRPPFVRLGHARDEAGTFGDAPAEAWVYDIAQEGDVLYALAWPTSREVVNAVRQKRYRFASPEYNPNYADKESGARLGPVLEAIGLTNEPFLTKLPETVVLADPPGTIYLDYEEIKEVDNPMENELLKENNSLLKKLADGFTRFLESFKPGSAGTDGLSEEARQKLAEVDDLKVKLASMETKLKDSEANASEARNTAWASQVETRLTALVAAGVPPAMCDQAKAILLANPAMGTTMIKLADNKEISMAEQIFATLDALPKEHRIMLAQRGAQESKIPGQVTAKEVYGDVVPELNK